MDMDSIQIESYSFRWLISMKDDSIATAASFIDIDPRLMSLRWTGEDASPSVFDASHETFDFGTAKVSSHSPEADKNEEEEGDGDGDDVISDTLDHRRPFDQVMLWSPESVLSRSVSLDSTRVLLSTSTRYDLLSPSLNSTSSSVRHQVFTNSTPVTRVKVSKFLKKYLCFLMPLYKKVKNLKKERDLKTTKSDGIMEYHRRRPSNRPTLAVDAAVDEGPEKSINEAVLHCKRSIRT